MQIKKIKRPWVPEQHSRKYEPFYRTSTWLNLRKSFMLGTTTLPDGKVIPNTICIYCYKEGKTTPANTIDHIHRIKDGGAATDINNLQALCMKCHNRKSGEEGNQVKMKTNFKKT